jgi:membrane protease YdiL (CAAX protease family)
VLLGIAMLQTIPTVLIHFPHPITETMGTVVFGFLSAVIVLRTRSVFPVLLIHALAGLFWTPRSISDFCCRDTA